MLLRPAEQLHEKPLVLLNDVAMLACRVSNLDLHCLPVSSLFHLGNNKDAILHGILLCLDNRTSSGLS